ncbi:MAG: helix-turn-helix transcriptional regulator [Lachnospiraceae bacterium]|nr:helix-turn-helix transcriptional regulator [Lachnospiraceae bacterium]MBR1573202.1 helix-turn-helix transcriptional regulator [Lachnospiraceae bacterium]
MARRYIWETPDEINMALANRVREIRRRRDITQQELSEKSGVSYGSLKRFESTGNISLISLTKIAVALEMENEIRQLFSDVTYKDIEEVIRGNR